jgi:hypothetical protein
MQSPCVVLTYRIWLTLDFDGCLIFKACGVVFWLSGTDRTLTGTWAEGVSKTWCLIGGGAGGCLPVVWFSPHHCPSVSGWMGRNTI